jgi:hypothetical protein
VDAVVSIETPHALALDDLRASRRIASSRLLRREEQEYAVFAASLL